MLRLRECSVWTLEHRRTSLSKKKKDIIIWFFSSRQRNSAGMQMVGEFVQEDASLNPEKNLLNPDTDNGKKVFTLKFQYSWLKSQAYLFFNELFHCLKVKSVESKPFLWFSL